MRQAIKILLITYILASKGEQQDKKWNIRKELKNTAAKTATYPNENQRSEYRKLAQQWYKGRIKAGHFTFVEAQEGINNKIVDAGLKPIQKNTEIKSMKKHHQWGKNRKNNVQKLDNDFGEASYELVSNQNYLMNDTNIIKNDQRRNLKNQTENGVDKANQKKSEKCTSQESEVNSIEMQEIQNDSLSRKLEHLDERTMVSDDGFGYMVVVLKGAKGFLSAGALIDESWVLTSAEQVKSMSETFRLMRVRLGSVNYKKGGFLLPIKDLEIHPYYKKNKANYDLALLMLAKPVRLTPSIKIIRLQLVPKELTSTHLILSSWAARMVDTEVEKSNPIVKKATRTVNQNAKKAPGIVKRNAILTVTHLHATDPEECSDELSDTDTDPTGLMCLVTGIKDACHRDPGAPVVVNGVLWAVVSGWMLECDEINPMPVLATVISDVNVSSWIHSTVHGHNWRVTIN